MGAWKSRTARCIALKAIALCLFGWIGMGAGGGQAQEKLPNTPVNRLYQAVHDRNVETVRALLVKGVDPNASNARQTPPIIANMEFGLNAQAQIDILRLLLQYGARPNSADDQGKTALISVAATIEPRFHEMEGETVKAAAILIAGGAEIDRQDKQGATALVEALEMKNVSLVRFLLAKGADIHRNGGYLKYTPLHYVACAGDTERVKTLLKAGADVNAADILEQTPLALAALNGSLPTLQALLDAGADVNRGRLDVGNALQNALEAKHPEAALLLLKHGAKVNIRDNRIGATPLLQAFRLSRAEAITQWDAVIQAILDAGVDVNAADTGQATPLICAIEDEKELNAIKVAHIDWVRRLLDQGAKADLGVGWRTPLSTALAMWPGETRRLEIAALLVERGADVNAEVGGEGYRHALLVEMTEGADESAVDFLLNHGAKVNCLDSAHKTPLHWAAFQGKLDLVKRLLAKGADLQAKDTLGQSPLMLARKGNHPEVVAFLKQQGATDPQAAAPARNAQGQVVLRLPLSWRNGPLASEKLRFVEDASGKAPALMLYEGVRPATLPIPFTSLLGDPGIWPHSELNTIHYQLQRGYYMREGYQFCGLIHSHDRTYLGIRWYSPPSSYQEIFTVCVFRLDVKSGALELTLLRKTGVAEGPGTNSVSVFSKIPFLSKSAAGDLLMTGTDGVFALGAQNVWRKVAPAPKSH